jgi:myosin protein heavy chain
LPFLILSKLTKLTYQKLEEQLETQLTQQSQSQRSVRNVDRTVKDLQVTIERKEKANTQLQEDISRSRDKVEKLLKAIDELQQSESDAQLQAKRAEREAREAKEQKLRLERENEGWKAAGMGRPGSVMGGTPGRRMGSGQYSGDGGVEIPQRKSSLSRTLSTTKGFL